MWPALLGSAFLRSCLRAKRYDVDRTKKMLRNYLQFRRREKWLVASPAGDCARPVCAAAIERELRSGVNTLLRDGDIHGHVVVTQRMGLIEASGGSLESHQRAGYYLLHRALQREGAQTRGLALLLDFRGFGWSLFRQIGWHDIQRGMAMLQESFPARLAVIYVLHPPRWLSRLVTVLRPLLRRDSLQQKFVLLRDVAALHALIPRDRLPAGIDAALARDDAPHSAASQHASHEHDWGGTAPPHEWDALIDGWIAEEAELGDLFDPAALV